MPTRSLVPVNTPTLDRKPAIRRDASIRPTQETYDALQIAFDYFNDRLFNDGLPNCVITLKRHGRSHGFFSGSRFTRRDGQECDEIALNSVSFQDRSIAETLSTLVHEMVHLWQHHHGQPGRGGYHNRQWANRMKQLGLHPSDTGQVGGKETGDRMSHYIVDDGLFAKAMIVLDRRGFAIPWAEIPAAQQNGGSRELSVDGPPKSGERVKYVCPECELADWAKHDAAIACVEHNAQMLPE